MKGIILAWGSGYIGCRIGCLDSGIHIMGKRLCQLAKRLLKNQYSEYLMNLLERR